MTSLPITNSTTQSATNSKAGSSAADNSDVQNSQPFGDVLARQIKNPATKDAKVDEKTGAGTLAQLLSNSGTDKKASSAIKKDTVDTKKATPSTTDTASNLPTDMLAALLPQAVNTSAAVTTKSSDKSAIDSVDTALDKTASAAQKANIAAVAQADSKTKPATGENLGSSAKEQSFATAIPDSAKQISGSTGQNAVAKEAITTITAPQSNAAALASLQSTAASLAAPVQQPVQVTINTQVSQGKWADEFSQKITWLASSNKDQTAELHLNPPQLGPVDVVIKVSGDQATALFTSPHAAVRDAIEQAMPKLRDMMADNGIMLGNATVSDQAPRDQGQFAAQRTPVLSANEIREIPVVAQSTTQVSQIARHNGIVDTFA